MSFLRCAFFLLCAMTMAVGQTAQPGDTVSLPQQPEALVRSFYEQVVARHLLGIPEDSDMKVIAPYLSKGLLHKFDLAKACSADWDRRDPDTGLRATMASQEGLFSGSGAEAEPQTFQIEKVESQRDGFLRVYVDLKSAESSEGQWNWRVAATVQDESGHAVIDDVIYINDATYDKEDEKPANRRLSEYLSAGCNGPHWIGNSLPDQPKALIRSLYEQVAARRSGGIPEGEDMKIFMPYLSRKLLHEIDLTIACAKDWNRQNNGQPVKAPFGWSEAGLFSGSNERGEPRTFHVERMRVEKDGSFRVYVGLTWGGVPPDSLMKWRVAAIVVRENDRLVVDDVIYLKDKDNDVEWRLSELLTHGCDGARWVGFDDKEKTRK